MQKSTIRNYLSNWRLILFGYLIVIAAGIYGWLTLPRELMPSVDLPVAVVSVVLPGASPQDVEDLVTVPLEDQLRGINGLDHLRASSMENSSLIIMQFEDGMDSDKIVQDVREKVESTSLPDNALDPYVGTVDFDETPVLTFALEGSDKIGLIHVAEGLQKQLERQSTIDRVEISGIQDREIVVYVAPSDMQKYGVHPAVLAQAVAAATTNVPAGSVNVETLSYAVSIEKDVTDVASLRSLPIVLNGVEYQLGDIAQIYEQEEPGGSNSYQMDAEGDIKQVVTLNVYKIAGSAIDANAQLARKVTEEYLADYPQYDYKMITDMGEQISDRFSNLFTNIWETIALVFVIMFIFLGAREALIAAISIPIVMLLSFGGMVGFNLSLNFISLFALLLVLGMLVDNAIVVVTALSRAFGNGEPALQAGVNVWQEFFVALISTNLTTIWAFLPLLLVSGIMGKFIHPIGIIVTIAMLGSALVAFLLTLPLGIYVMEPRLPTRLQKFILVFVVAIATGTLVYMLPKTWLLLVIIPVFWAMLYFFAIYFYRKTKERQLKRQRKTNKVSAWLQHGFISTAKLERSYQKLLTGIVSDRRQSKLLLTAIAIITVVAFALPIAGLVHSSFFPKEEGDYFELELTLPAGTNTTEVERVALEILPQFAHMEDLDYVTAQIGRGGSSALLASGSSNKILFTFNLVPEKDRHSSSIELAQAMRDAWRDNPYGTAQVNEDSTTSAGGSDIQMYIVGEDLDVLKVKSQEMVAWLENEPGVTDISSSLDEESKRLVFRPFEQTTTNYGLSANDFAVWLRSNLSGWTLGSLRLDGDDEDTDITLRQQQGEPDISDLQKIQVPVSGVGYLPLSSLGELTVEPNLAQIDRYNYNHSVTITASVKDGYSSTEINTRFENFIDGDLNLPAGYGRELGGAQDMNQSAVSGLVTAMFVAFFLIMLTLVLQLRSFRKAFIVMSVIPVAVSGVFINFALLNWSLTMPSIIGILALFGIVVNNSILIVERINQNLAEGRDFLPSVIEGCTSRLQPILLTSLTTIFGLLPITLSDPMWQGLGGSIIAGLTFSGVLLLLYIPALYVLMFEPKTLRGRDRKWQEKWQKYASP